MTTNKPPTEDMYLFIQYAYKYFNQKLFNDQLPPCLLTLQRKNNVLGYFHSKRFINSENKNITDEIALNPCFFATRSMEATLSTLVHEQVHLSQNHYGNPGRRGYHNREWGTKMKEIGLFPSNTGQAGGKETGEKMSHYIIYGGAFDIAYRALFKEEAQIPWIDRYPAYVTDYLLTLMDKLDTSPTDSGDNKTNTDDSSLILLPTPVSKPNKSNRLKYTCPNCKTSVWGKPDLNILCGNEECQRAIFDIVN